ncbi:uncharacterized protein LOC127007092 isoform X2 [Eriocheir sinensis]|uniref:uncharacterized protein LOC127007092 isoform X2 n=1 Tax=Eriocheir sinensis TaxID=95602 RepID=UPI0021C7555A|nr:uncharacterized protein LOC127007092 isoform X2 [Eriocheir sinensis]
MATEPNNNKPIPVVNKRSPAMREGGQVSLPPMRRGLSPEGRRIRERHSQGSLTIGVQGVTVHPTERVGRSQSSFLQENVRRLREIQTRCREREQPTRNRQPLRATRVPSAATSVSSSFSKTDGRPAGTGSPLKAEGGGGAGRGGSAHSDYYSLSEDPSDPPPPTHPHYPSQEWAANLAHSKHSTTSRGSRPQSPVVLRPLTNSMPQPPGEEQQLILPDAGLSKEMRKLRMENLVSRISSQRPACEMDYHQHYRAIENQHRLLLDAAERINSSSGEGASGGSGGDSTRGRGSQAWPGTPQKMVRAYSFDRGTSARRRDGSTERKAKTGELKALRKLNHRPPSPSPSSSSSFFSPQLGRRFSKAAPKPGAPVQNASADSLSGKQPVGGVGSTGTELLSRGEVTGSRGVLRGTSARSRGSANTQHSDTRPASRPGSKWRKDAEDNASLLEETNLNSTFSSSCDFYPAGHHEEPESPRHATQDNLKLAIRPDSQNSMADGDQQTNNPNRNDWSLTYHDGTQNSTSPREQTEATEREDGLHAEEEGRTDRHTGRNENGDVCYTQLLGPLPPVQGIRGHEDATITTPTIASPSHRRRERQQQQQQRTQNNPLRRSQSLKNVTHSPGEPPPTYQLGRIPRYLRARKEEARRQEEMARAVDPDCPPGHQPLPDHERQNTLHLLHKSQSEVLRELSCLPVAQDTLRVKRARQTLEDKLTQIEEGLRIFSQPRVYIMNDD